MSSGGPPVFRRIAIVGCGLIGGSLGLAIRRRWPDSHVIGIDRPEVLAQAVRLEAITAGGDDLGHASGADLIALAAPVRRNLDVLRRLPQAIAGDALVTDVGSTKGTTVEAARALPERLRFIGGHPLAGAAVGGIEAARADLFDERTWLLTPDVTTADAHLRQLEGFLSGVGAIPRRIGIAEHDRLLADVSHLPQMTASALMHVVGQRVGEDGLALAGRGLRDTTRLAASPADIWRDVAGTNHSAVGAALDDLISVLQSIRDDLRRGDRLQQVFESAGRWKRVLDREQPE